MRFIITYTDYKYQRIRTLNINHNLKNISPRMSCSLSSNYNTITEKQPKINKSFDICDKISKYIDETGNNNYRIDLIPHAYIGKQNRMDILTNNICNTIFVNILESDITAQILTAKIDEDMLEKYNITNIPNIDIEIQIYDKNSVFDRIYC